MFKHRTFLNIYKTVQLIYPDWYDDVFLFVQAIVVVELQFSSGRSKEKEIQQIN
jgi:hypothetical protein